MIPAVLQFVGLRYGTPFAAVIDSHARDPFMPEHPLKAILDGKSEQVPFILGSVPYEMSMFLPGMTLHPKPTAIADSEFYSRIIYISRDPLRSKKLRAPNDTVGHRMRESSVRISLLSGRCSVT